MSILIGLDFIHYSDDQTASDRKTIGGDEKEFAYSAEGDLVDYAPADQTVDLYHVFREGNPGETVEFSAYITIEVIGFR